MDFGFKKARKHLWVAVAPVIAVVGLTLPQSVGASPAGSTVSPSPTTTMAGMGDGMLPAGNWTPSQRAFLLDLIARTEAALPAFADPNYLVSLGFHNFGVDAPGGYVHYINNAWINDGHILDPNHPESILFQRVYDPTTNTSKLELRAAMYFLPSGTTMSNIPPQYAWIPGWHVHPDICVTDGGTFAGLASNGMCASGHPMDGPPMTHVWVVNNACGNRFSMVDVGGLMCVDDMDMGSSTTMPGMDMGSSTTMPGMDMGSSTTMSGMDMGSSTTMSMGAKPSTAPAAMAVSAQPTFTG